MSVQTFRADQAITVTQAAADHFARELKNKSAKAVRVSLKQAGCTGFKYVIDQVDSGEADDIQLDLSNGVTLYIDPKHISALHGTVVDYVQEGLNKSLVLNNPNVKDMCGCGESFNVQ